VAESWNSGKSLHTGSRGRREAEPCGDEQLPGGVDEVWLSTLEVDEIRLHLKREKRFRFDLGAFVSRKTQEIQSVRERRFLYSDKILAHINCGFTHSIGTSGRSFPSPPDKIAYCLYQ
jgi:hypothetical protein